MKKRLICLLLTVPLLLGVWAFPVSAEEFPSTCGESATWAFDSATGTLTVSGTGAMAEVSGGFWQNISFQRQVTKILVEEGITVIGKNAFNCLQGVKSVQLPNTLLRIEEGAFFLCDGITSIKFPDSLQYIGQNAFWCCGLKTLELPESLTECGPEAFSNNTSLKSVTLPNSLEKIPHSLFDNCYNLTAITIPAGVKEVDAWPFSMCSQLSTVTFLGDAPAFHKNAFRDNILVACYPADNPTWTQDKRQNYGGTVTWLPSGDAPIGGTFGKSSKMEWKLEKGTLTITGNGYMDGWSNFQEVPWYPYRGLVKKVVLSGKIENIYSYAFRECTALKQVIWTPTVTTIFSGAFRGCTSLAEITLPEAVTLLGPSAFSDCTALRVVNLGKNIKEINESAFRRCTSLKSVTFPASVKHLHREIFYDSGIETLRFQGEMPTFMKNSYDSGTLGGLKNVTVYYPAGNSTWTADKIDEVLQWYGGKNIQFKAEGQVSPPAGGNNAQNTPTNPPKTTQPATIPETTQLVETTTSTNPPEETIVEFTDATEFSTSSSVADPSVDSDHDVAPEADFPWALVIVVALAAVAVGAVLIFKKRK